MRRRLLALGGAAVLAVAACSSGTHHTAPTTAAPAPSTTAPPNPDVIPPVITVPYVNAVLAALNHVYGNGTRALRTAHSVTPQVRSDLRSIFNDPLYTQQAQAASLSLHGVIKNVRPDPGDLRTTVVQLFAASASCIFIQTKTDFSAAFIHQTPQPASEYFELAPKPVVNDPDHLNPTPWAFAVSLAYLTPTSVPNPCKSA